MPDEPAAPPPADEPSSTNAPLGADAAPSDGATTSAEADADVAAETSTTGTTDGATTGAAAPAASRQRLYLIGVAALVVVLLLGFLVVRGRGEPSTGALPTTDSSTGPTLPPISGTVGTLPEGTAFDPEVPDTFPAGSVETFAPAEVQAAPPNTHTLPPSPYLVATPKNAGQLAIYPSAGAAKPTQTLANPILVNNDPNAKVPLTLLVNKAQGRDWLEVFLPVRPNGSTGFIKTSDVTLTSHKYHIEVRLGAFNLKVYDGTNLVMDTQIAVAAANTPTPGGLYYTNMLLQPPSPNLGYGTYAYGLSGFSDVLKSFNNGPGQLGIHGGGDDRTIGHRVSHGCIRMRNSDIEKLVPVLPLGVPVQIFA